MRDPKQLFTDIYAIVRDYNLLRNLPTLAGRILRGEISDLFDTYPAKNSMNAVTSDGIARAIEDAGGGGTLAQRRGSVRKNSSDFVGQFIDTGWTYYRNRGGAGSRTFVYGHTTVIDPGFTAGGKDLDCSALIGLMLRGIPYEHSRYADMSSSIGANGKYSWTVDPYDFKNINKKIPGEGPSVVRTAAQLGEWMSDNGLRIDQGIVYDDPKNGVVNFDFVEPGDIIFYAKRSKENPEEWVEPDRYMHISHVTAVVGKHRPDVYSEDNTYSAGSYAFFDEDTAGELRIMPGIHECMRTGTVPDPDTDDWRYVVNGRYYHTMLEATDTAYEEQEEEEPDVPVVLNRVLELNLAKRIVMIARPDLGAVTDGEFRGNLKTEFNIESLDDVWFDCFCFLTHEITGGLPELLRNTGDVADTGTGFALKTETTYRKNGQPYSIIQKIIDTRSIHNNEIYTRTKYLMISDGEYYRPDDPASEWTDWNLLVNKEILDTVMEANGLGELGLDAYGHWQVTGQVTPSAQVPADWNATEGVARILNKPELKTVATSGSYNDLTNKPTLFSGNYNDLSNKPTIPAAQVPADWNETSGLARILNKPAWVDAAETSGTVPVKHSGGITWDFLSVFYGYLQVTYDNQTEKTAQGYSQADLNAPTWWSDSGRFYITDTNAQNIANWPINHGALLLVMNLGGIGSNYKVQFAIPRDADLNIIMRYDNNGTIGPWKKIATETVT